MSMTARFVQVTPDLLAHLLRSPSSVTELLAPDEDAQIAPVALTDSMRQDWLRRMPQLLAGPLAALDPAMREAMEKRLGVSVESLQSGGGGEAILKALARRGLVRPQGDAEAPPDPAGRSREGKGESLSLGKAWHGVHYLLCGEVENGATVLSQAVLGGSELGDDLGYGPARYFTAEEVSAAAGALSRTDLEAEMKARFDPAQMTRLGIYPQRWDGGDAEWLWEEFGRLREFYVQSSARQLAVVTCIV